MFKLYYVKINIPLTAFIKYVIGSFYRTELKNIGIVRVGIWCMVDNCI